MNLGIVPNKKIKIISQKMQQLCHVLSYVLKKNKTQLIDKFIGLSK